MVSKTGRGWIRLLLMGTLLISGAAVAESMVTAGSRAAKLSQCVEPTAEMRRNHFAYIEHERDETVHRGIRGRKHSLAGCVDCHAGKDPSDYLPVTAEGQFCSGCHEYVGTSITCFQCHSALPAGQHAAAGGGRGLGEAERGPADRADRLSAVVQED